MEELFLIESVRWYRNATPDQICLWEADLRKSDRKELLVFPDPADQGRCRGILLSKYFSPALSELVGVREVIHDGEFVNLSISRTILRTFIGSLVSKIVGRAPAASLEPSVSELMDLGRSDIQPQDNFSSKPAEETGPLGFLKSKTPAKIEAELNEVVIGQPALTRAVADFLYYHALRQLHPQLPQRPLLIAGPSGSGKTEVWRVADRLYGQIFPIRIIDGSNMSCEGWSGNYKIDTYMDPKIVSGGILVVDEFDKLTKPKHSGHGDNVSLDMQAEFLKLVEGEYCITDKRKKTSMTSKQMGFVMVGAFESLRKEKTRPCSVEMPRIGFCTETSQKTLPASNGWEDFTDEDFISYGIMPELVGRIAIKCGTVPLSDQDYLNIICGPNSRVAMIKDILKSYGTEVSDLISPEEIRKLVATSQTNQTGVRWVSAQVETRLLEAIRQDGLFSDRQMAS